MFRKATPAGLFATVTPLIICVALLTGCSSTATNDDTTSAEPADITVSASPSTVEVNATAVIEATLTDGGAAVAGQTVTFSVEPSGAGYLTPETIATDANGVAAAVFTASVTGAIRVPVIATPVPISISCATQLGSSARRNPDALDHQRLHQRRMGRT